MFGYFLVNMANLVQKAWDKSVREGYIVMLYVQKGWTMKEIGRLIGSSKQYVNKVLKKHSVSGEYNGTGNVYTSEELCSMLNQAHNNDSGDIITYTEWNNKYSPPHAQTFTRRFGSWEKALNSSDIKN